MYFIMKKNFRDYSFDFFELLQNLDPALVETLSKKINSFNKNKFTGKIWLFGNGGSQATCSHIATDLTTNTNNIKVSKVIFFIINTLSSL